MIASAPKPVISSSSALPSHRYHTEPRALRTHEVEQMVAAYGRCAEVAAQAGIDGIEFTAAHGYLGQQFFDPHMNQRNDRYAEGERFVLEVIDAIRSAAPDLALGVRLSADSPVARRSRRAWPVAWTTSMWRWATRRPLTAARASCRPRRRPATRSPG